MGVPGSGHGTRLGEHELHKTARLLHALTTTLLVGCVVVQVFLAGLGVFDNPTMFITHAGFGGFIGLLTIVVLITAVLAHAGRRQIGLAALTFVLMMLQSVFVAVRADLPAVAALHPVNGFLIGLIAVVMARAATLAVLVAEPERAHEVGGAGAVRA